MLTGASMSNFQNYKRSNQIPVFYIVEKDLGAKFAHSIKLKICASMLSQRRDIARALRLLLPIQVLSIFERVRALIMGMLATDFRSWEGVCAAHEKCRKSFVYVCKKCRNLHNSEP